MLIIKKLCTKYNGGRFGYLKYIFRVKNVYLVATFCECMLQGIFMCVCVVFNQSSGRGLIYKESCFSTAQNKTADGIRYNFN